MTASTADLEQLQTALKQKYSFDIQSTLKEQWVALDPAKDAGGIVLRVLSPGQLPYTLLPNKLYFEDPYNQAALPGAPSALMAPPKAHLPPPKFKGQEQYSITERSVGKRVMIAGARWDRCRRMAARW